MLKVLKVMECMKSVGYEGIAVEFPKERRRAHNKLQRLDSTLHRFYSASGSIDRRALCNGLITRSK